MVMPGDKAPDFRLQAYHKGDIEEFSLRTFEGKWVVFFFWPLDFTFVCPTEVKGFSQRYSEFKRLNAEVLGVSVDSVYCHKGWVEKELGEIEYPLLSDFFKEISRAYGVLKEDKGVALRATFIIDPHGIVQWVNVSNLEAGRSVSEVLRALQALQTGELCPLEWKPGEKTLGKP